MKFFFKLLKWFIMGGQQIGVEIGGFKQNVRRALINSCLTSVLVIGCIAYNYPPQFKRENLTLYFRAIIDSRIHKVRCSLLPSRCTPHPTMQTNNGRQVYIRDVLSNRSIHRDLNNIKTWCYKTLTYFLIFVVGILGVFSISFIILGRRKDANDTSNKPIIHTASQVNKYLKKKKLGYLQAGGMHFPKDSEVTHTLALGSTGTGKTNLIHTLGSQIRNHNQSAIVIDPTGEMIDRHYDKKKKDIIFNIGDEKSYGWDLRKELETPGILSTFCTSICSQGKNNAIPFWEKNSHILLKAIIQHVMSKPDPTLGKVYDFLRTSDRQQLLDTLKDTGARHLLEEQSPETSQNIIMTLTSCINWLEHIDLVKSDTFSINAFCQEVDQNPTGKWLFISFPPDTRELFKTLSNVILSLFLSSAKRLKPNLDRRIFLIMDELASFGNLKEIRAASAELRKYGGCILAATQGIDQLREIYGPSATQTILNQFRTKFFFAGMMEQSLLDSTCGLTEVERKQESFSYGTHEMRDGISISKSNVSKSLVTTSDVYNLETFECYVALTEPKIRCAKIQVPLFK